MPLTSPLSTIGVDGVAGRLRQWFAGASRPLTGPNMATGSMWSRPAVYLIAALALVAIVAGTKSWSNVVDLYRDRYEGQSAQGPHEDYVAFYSAGRMVREFHGDRLYDIDAMAYVEVETMGRPVGGVGRGGVLAFLNPPFVAALFAPLSALPIELAAVIIGLIGGGLVLVAGFSLERLLDLKDPIHRALFWLVFLSLYSVSWVVLHGQLSMLLLLGWFLFITFQVKGKESLSGAGLALLLIKPQMAVLPVIVLLWKKRWRTLAAFAAIVYVLVAVSLLVSGPGVLVDYPRFILDSMGWDRWGITPDSMYGWNGFAARLTDNNSIYHYALTGTLCGITAFAALFTFKGGWEPQKPRFFLQCSVMVAAALLLNPHLYMQDLSLMALALALPMAYSLRAGRPVYPWIALAVAVWASQQWGFWLLDNADFNINTPVIVLFLITLLLLLRQGEAVARTEPALPMEGGLRALYVLQGGYIAFIIAFSIVRGGFVLPDVMFILLVAGFAWGKRRVLFIRDFAPLVLLLFSYDAMRGIADDLAKGVHVGYPITLDKLLFFGHVPTQDLQRWFSDATSFHWYDSLASAVYGLHFVVPLIFAALIWQYRRGKYWRFMIALLLTSYAAFVTFMLVPTAPPWLASWAGSLDDVRLIQHTSYSFFIYRKASPNPVAAMPSLHASYPWLFFLFAIHLWGKRGSPVILYAFAVFLVCVYLGHHYVADIIGGVIYATVAFYVVCGPIGDFVVNRLSSRARRAEGAASGAEEIGEPVEAVAVASGAADANRRSTELEAPT